MIQTRRLTRRFGDLCAVDRLDLDVAPGEVLGFLGPNGAGTTTTVRMLTGLIAPTSGTATVAGHSIIDAPDAVRRSVGILTETPGMYDRLTARRNLEIFASLYGVADVAGQVEKYLRLLSLWDRRDDPAGSFSKGMRQKLAICRALLHEPPLIFLDEPTSALDPAAAKQVRAFIRELSGQGRTIFICTHNLQEADELCDRVAVFSGRLLVLEEPERLRAQIYGQQLRITLERVDEGLRAVVAALPFSPEVALTVDGLLVRADPAHTPDIVAALVAAGGRIRAVAEVAHSLEKVYLELLSQAGAEGRP
jgi:ABC-2 type transport system ATP-binding protein